ncbi:MAG: 5-oxoprolinase subunit C family protein [Henriciella sp.]
MLHILTPGLQTTLQGAPRTGFRAFGIPYAGPADEVSMALANRLVGNAPTATCLEITYGGFEAELEATCTLAITGAVGEILLNGTPVPAHQTLHGRAGDKLTLSPPQFGARAYLAIASGFQAQSHFGSNSTYLPAELGGHDGRALRAGDRLTALSTGQATATLSTPEDLIPVFSEAFALRTCESAETHLLTPRSRDLLFNTNFVAGRQATRMGIELTGPPLEISGDGLMKSAPVFPGTIQCPQSGIPIALSCDAQTTGGYPRIASIARCDRHQLGQIRPGNSVLLLKRTPEEAVREGLEKQTLLKTWLGSALP